MEPMSARAFLALILKKSTRQDILDIIRDFEKRNLPSERYLQGSEICRYLRRIGSKNIRNKIELTNPSADQVSAVGNLWKEYERNVIWPGEQFEHEHPKDVAALSKQEQIHRWEDWACVRLEA